MTLTRRTFNRTLTLALASAFATQAVPSLAQGRPVNEGIDYRVLSPRQAVSTDAKKIEVVEFFWFGCPHCNSLDPALLEWLKKAPADVVFKRVHINFDDENAPVKRTEVHQRLFYTLETMGVIEKMAPAVFTAIHGDRKPLQTRDSVLEWAKTKGLDLGKFTATYDDGFNMSRKMKAASAMQAAYKVDGVPYFAIDGQFITSPSIAGGSTDAFFNVMNTVIEKVRKARAPAKAELSVDKKADKKPAKPVKASDSK